MAVDITSIEINKYNIQYNLCSYWLSSGDPEGKKIPLLGPPLIHDNIQCMTVHIRNKDLGRKTKDATLVQQELEYLTMMLGLKYTGITELGTLTSLLN